MTRRALLVAVALGVLSPALPGAEPPFRAGAAAADVTPEKFPVVVNCGFVEASGAAARDKLHARALVLDDGRTKLAIVIVDSCMMPREFLDRVKKLVEEELKIPADRQLIAATHTHTAPAVMGCLGSDPDPNYPPFLERQIVSAVRGANANLAPAKVGSAVVLADGLTNNRQWILRSDKVRNDPFGKPTVRSNMHPGYLHPDFVGPSGPTDPWLTVLSVRTADDKPLAVLANFSMHYFGSAPVSADYFDRVCANLEKRYGEQNPKFVALHSQGTAGDLHWMDYGKAQTKQTIDDYATAVTDKVEEALKKVEYRSDVPLAMKETKLTIPRRVPDKERLAWARGVVAELKGAKPKTQPEIYAREAIFLHDEPKRELKLQALRVGDLGLAAIPNEVFALTGLKIKARSPFKLTCVLELANGAEGYIPPPEQHVLGGYTTWPARSAALAEHAEWAITEAACELLGKVAGKEAGPEATNLAGPYADRILEQRPVAYWRLGDLNIDLRGSVAVEMVDLKKESFGKYESGVVFGLPGPCAEHFRGLQAVNRAAHFAGGRMTAKLPKLDDKYTVELWVWNGFPADARDWTGTPLALANGTDAGDFLALGGKKGTANVLTLFTSANDDAPVVGKTALPFRKWVHVALVRDGEQVRVYLNGEEEISAKRARAVKPDAILVGGRPDKTFGFEGRVAEVAVFDRVLKREELAARLQAVKK
jgi:hypothetical protein